MLLVPVVAGLILVGAILAIFLRLAISVARTSCSSVNRHAGGSSSSSSSSILPPLRRQPSLRTVAAKSSRTVSTTTVATHHTVSDSDVASTTSSTDEETTTDETHYHSSSQQQQQRREDIFSEVHSDDTTSDITPADTGIEKGPLDGRTTSLGFGRLDSGNLRFYRSRAAATATPLPLWSTAITTTNTSQKSSLMQTLDLLRVDDLDLELGDHHHHRHHGSQHHNDDSTTTDSEVMDTSSVSSSTSSMGRMLIFDDLDEDDTPPIDSLRTRSNGAKSHRPLVMTMKVMKPPILIPPRSLSVVSSVSASISLTLPISLADHHPQLVAHHYHQQQSPYHEEVVDEAWVESQHCCRSGHLNDDSKKQGRVADESDTCKRPRDINERKWKVVLPSMVSGRIEV